MLYQLSYVRTSAGPTRSYLRRASTLGANPDGVQCPRSRAAVRGASRARAPLSRFAGAARPNGRIEEGDGVRVPVGPEGRSSGPTPLRPTGTQVTSRSGASTRREHVSFFKSDRESGHHLRAIGAAVARFPDTEEVTGSNPVSPTHQHEPRSADRGFCIPGACLHPVRRPSVSSLPPSSAVPPSAVTAGAASSGAGP